MICLKSFFFSLEESLSKRVFLFLGSKLGMAIWARLAGTWSGPTLMGQVLPDPIKNRVGFGFKKKNPKRGRVFSRVRVLKKPGPNLDPDPTWLAKYKITKKDQVKSENSKAKSAK